MKHLLWMAVFATLVAIVFGVVAKGTNRHRLIYGLKVFAQFMLIALALGWALYFLPLR
ncbi:MAG TPA: hypothetical protein VHE60_01510 [Pyrinomonadaceae bacterium]|nr:hypothetical protein [Pyrinomonadaceae bacterium]